jgi:hypothetical protein
LLVGQLACLAAIVLAGRASAERPGAGGQGAWVAVALAGALVSAAGNGVWLGVLRRAATSRRRAIFARLAEYGDRASTGAAGRADAAARPVMVAGLRLRHRPDCPLVVGKAVVSATADAEPCGWCSP